MVSRLCCCESAQEIVRYRAWLGADNYGNPVAYLYTADRPNRIYCYLLRPFYDDTVVEELTLDELLAYARQAVGQS